MTHSDLPDVAQRFLRYVAIDTQSAEGTDRYPSTEKQKHLGRLLVSELSALGLTDVLMDDFGVVMATVPATPGCTAPVIGLIAHLDTSPDVSGENVQAVIHRAYAGGPLPLAATGDQITPEDSPHLLKCHGHDVISTDGTTLLGADDKAGVAEIVSAAAYLLAHPELRHGPIRLGFTCDEEVGRGTAHFDVTRFGAVAAYTLDGGAPGEIENETFCADLALVTVKGRNVHPGYAKDKLVNALKGAAAVVAALPVEAAPETTEKRQGYLHPVGIAGSVEEATVRILVRDFEEAGLASLEQTLRSLADQVASRHPGLTLRVEIRSQYRNMRSVLDKDPRIVGHALEAARRAGITPDLTYARGGTDGANLSFMGLPTPNVFAGGQNFHSRREWVSIQDMESAVRTLVELAQLWAG